MVPPKLQVLVKVVICLSPPPHKAKLLHAQRCSPERETEICEVEMYVKFAAAMLRQGHSQHGVCTIPSFFFWNSPFTLSSTFRTVAGLWRLVGNMFSKHNLSGTGFKTGVDRCIHSQQGETWRASSISKLSP